MINKLKGKCYANYSPGGDGNDSELVLKINEIVDSVNKLLEIHKFPEEKEEFCEWKYYSLPTGFSFYRTGCGKQKLDYCSRDIYCSNCGKRSSALIYRKKVRMMAEVKWIKITTDVFDDEKILLIESMPSADSIITIWFKLLILAGKQNNNGVFMMSNKLPFTDEMLATIFRRDLNTVRLALKTFEEFGMIEVVDNVITIPNWNKHQTLDAYEKKKERDRLYQQNRRKKQKNLIEQKSPDKSSDVAVSDKEEEKEEDKEKENIKENSLSTDSGDLFDFDDAWKKTFDIYPKKTAYSTSKTAWMDKVLEVIEENQPDIARLLYKATEAYLSDYQEKNPDDTDFRYIPKYVDWLKNDCDYWLQIAEKRGDCS